MPYPTFLAGQTITAALLNAGKLEFVTNAGGTQTNATTTFADATSLVFAVEANSRYKVHALIAYDAPLATDAKFAWTAPAGASMGRNTIGAASTLAATNLDTNASFIRRGTGTAVVAGGAASVANAFTVYEEIVDVQVSTTAGNLQFQFASNAAGTTTLQGDCVIWYQRIL
jgi:hypothetical protein